MLPNFFAASHFQKNELEHVIPDWKGGNSGMHILYPPTKSLPTRIRAFIDIAHDQLKELN